LVSLSPCLFLLLLIASPARALQPDEIALIINSNEPKGRELAQFYAEQRHIPDNRILELSLPQSEEMGFSVYEEQVVPQVREFLRTGRLEQQVKCFVTFYGVPIRIAARIPTPADTTELERIRITMRQTVDKITPSVKRMEDLAKQLDTRFQPGTGTDFDQLRVRVDRAMQTINSQMLTIPDEHRQLEVAVQLIDALEPLFGLSAKVRRAELDAQLNPTSKPSATQPTAQELADRRLQALEEAKRLEQLRFDPKARDDLRHVVAKNFGLL